MPGFDDGLNASYGIVFEGGLRRAVDCRGTSLVWLLSIQNVSIRAMSQSMESVCRGFLGVKSLTSSVTLMLIWASFSKTLALIQCQCECFHQ